MTPAGEEAVRSWLRRRLRPQWRRIAWLFAILGPGVITSNVDNDAGGIYTYSLAGARYGYSLLWILLPVTVALVVVQEMCARMGTVTGKGLADLIREHFGLRITFLVMMAVLVTNFGNAVAEFAGVASSLELFGVSRYVSVPLGAAFVWWLVVFGSYKSVEKAFLVACLIYVAYPFSGLLAHPDWEAALVGSVVPRMPLDLRGHRDGGRHRRHHDRAVDAVLPAVLGGREGVEGVRLPPGAARRDPRLGHGGGGGVLHRDRLRGDAAPRGHPRHRVGRRRRARSRPAGRALRELAVRRGPRERVAVRGVDPAPGDGLLRLRGARARGGGRPLVRRGPRVLLALHRCSSWAPPG